MSSRNLPLVSESGVLGKGYIGEPRRDHTQPSGFFKKLPATLIRLGTLICAFRFG